VVWLRYEPKTEAIEPEVSNWDEDNGIEGNPDTNEIAGEEPLERITSELTPVDYVYWQDFAHTPKARTWEEVTWVARRVYMTKAEGVERFGEVFKTIPQSSQVAGDKDSTDKDSGKNSIVWEIWNKPEKKVIWIAKDIDEILDERDDPLEFEDFFPCPKPLLATMTTGSMIPVADFAMYQDQANELDEISFRIRKLTAGLKVIGLYPAEEKSIQRLFKEGQEDGTLVPIENWPQFMESGGLDKMIHWVPLSDVIQALAELYKSRDALIQIIYQITGISDILRGATDAQETATAQTMKGQYASIRLGDIKQDIARFARDILRMKAHIICSKYQPETLVEMSGIMYTPDAVHAQEAIQILKNEGARNFSIDIEDNTLVQMDENQDKADRMAFLDSVSSFMEKVVPVAVSTPALAPLMAQMLLFAVRSFKTGAVIEAAFEKAIDDMQQAAQAKSQQPQQPSPEQLKIQSDQQIAQMKLQADQQAQAIKQQHEQQIEQGRAALEQAKAQAELELKHAQMQLENQRERDIETRELEMKRLQAQNEMMLEQSRQDFERWKTELQESTKIIIAEIGAKVQMDAAAMAAENKEVESLNA